MIDTDELKHLLAQATPGEWAVDEEPCEDSDGNRTSSPIGIVAYRGDTFADVMWNPDTATSWANNPYDVHLAAHSRELATEVIRLREAIETAAKSSESRASACDATNQLVAAVGHRETAKHLRNILNGARDA